MSLVKEEKAPALGCPDCGYNLIVRMKPDASPDLRLWCPVCDTYILPGLEMHHQVKRIIASIDLAQPG
jgi:hypothetical protein